MKNMTLSEQHSLLNLKFYCNLSRYCNIISFEMHRRRSLILKYWCTVETTYVIEKVRVEKVISNSSNGAEVKAPALCFVFNVGHPIPGSSPTRGQHFNIFYLRVVKVI